MDRLTQLELFVRTAELGVLTRAADSLGVSNAAASRYLHALEKRLGVRLVERTTRRLTLTQTGHDFYHRCKSLLDELGEAESAASASLRSPSGTLAVTASISFSKLHLAPIIPGFMRKYPQINVSVIGSNRYYDIIDSSIDLAIRTREFEPDSNLAIRKLASTRRILAATPGYLARHGQPRHVSELNDHQLLVYSYAHRPYVLDFKRGHEKYSMQIAPSVESNDGQIIRELALADGGILIQPLYVVDDDIAAGRLIPMLEDWDLPQLTINAAFQERRYMPAKTRLFIEYLVNYFRSSAFEQRWCRRF